MDIAEPLLESLDHMWYFTSDRKPLVAENDMISARTRSKQRNQNKATKTKKKKS